MTIDTQAELAFLVEAIVLRIRRIFYTSGAEIDRTNGPIEFTFSDGRILVFDSASNGQDLAVEQTAWSDPFAEPLSAENRAFVEENGKWSAFDVSQEADYAPLVGTAVSAVEQWHNPAGALIGATIHIGSRAVALNPNGDEMTISIDESAKPPA